MARMKLPLLAVGTALALLGGGLAGGGRILADDPSAGSTTPHRAAIHNGSCADLDPTPLFSLGEVAIGQTDGGPTDDAAAVPVGMATATLDVRLDEIPAGKHAIAVGEGAADQGALAACGDVGDSVTGDGLAVGLREQNGSGYAGIAWLRPDGERAAVIIFLARGLTSPAAAGGDTEATEAAVTFHVPTITCPTCPLRVEASVNQAPGILDVEFDGQDVTVTYDPSQVSPDEVAAAIEAGGDSVEPAES